jgi:hypothetical protein
MDPLNDLFAQDKTSVLVDKKENYELLGLIALFLVAASPFVVILFLKLLGMMIKAVS